MIGGLKNVNLVWVYRTAVIGCTTWLFVYESPRKYEGRMNAAPAVLSKEKVIYHGVIDLFPLTYMCVDIDFILFSD